MRSITTTQEVQQLRDGTRRVQPNQKGSNECHPFVGIVVGAVLGSTRSLAFETFRLDDTSHNITSPSSVPLLITLYV